jgi:hypothetical protein
MQVTEKFMGYALSSRLLLTNDICNTLWHRLLRDYLHQFKELFVNSCFNQAICGAKAAPTPPIVGDEYSTYRRTLGNIIAIYIYLSFRR